MRHWASSVINLDMRLRSELPGTGLCPALGTEGGIAHIPCGLILFHVQGKFKSVSSLVDKFMGPFKAVASEQRSFYLPTNDQCLVVAPPHLDDGEEPFWL